MKTMRTAAATVTAWAMTLSTALAATGAREDHSGILVWAFLGMCALIVVAQLFPAVLMVIGMAKGVVAPKEATVEVKDT